MKQTSIMLVVLGLTLMGCSESGSKKKSSVDCTLNPYQVGCSGYSNQLSCSQYPWMTGCSGGYTTGGTTGTTTGGTTGYTGGGSYGYGQYTSVPSDNNWQALYSPAPPSGTAATCATKTSTGTDLRVGTITLGGGEVYSPLNNWAIGEPEYANVSYTHNNSHFMTNLSGALGFYGSDARLKVRFKVRPQEKAPTGKSYCWGRDTGMSYPPGGGYTSLSFKVGLRRVINGTPESFYYATRDVTVGVNDCSSTLDFSGMAQGSDGVFLEVYNVKNMRCWYAQGCTNLEEVHKATCWGMDVQVSIDGSKDI